MAYENLLKSADMLAQVASWYARSLRKNGLGPRGVFWKNHEGQILRFEVLARLFENEPTGHPLSINDLGCGYGALVDFLRSDPQTVIGQYYGYDISGEMIEQAKQYQQGPEILFEHTLLAKYPADYSLVSGTYNLQGREFPRANWEAYIRESLHQLWQMTRKGMGFNMLMPLSGPPGPGQKGLYFAPPEPYLDFCRRYLSPNSELVTDYPLDEWTIFVRR